ncbi:MAG: hypothetical protein P1U50_06780 [Parvibaculaceae bacterium]|nr:hypothetical protein [Parvibaculaceae bacterium]
MPSGKSGAPMKRRPFAQTTLKASLVAASLSAVLGAGAGAHADEARFTVHQSEKGLVRLDTQTGHVSYCQERAGGMVCESAADDRLAYENEIAQLHKENQRLRRQVDLGDGELPTEEEIDEAFSMFETFAKRFSRTVRIFRGELDQPEDTENAKEPKKSD